MCLALAGVAALPILWALARTGIEVAPYRCPDGSRGTMVRTFGTTFFARGLTHVGIVRNGVPCAPAVR